MAVALGCLICFSFLDFFLEGWERAHLPLCSGITLGDTQGPYMGARD